MKLKSIVLAALLLVASLTFAQQPGPGNTNYQVLHSSTTGAPTWSQVELTTDALFGGAAVSSTTTDGYFVIPPSACGASTTGTAGTGNNSVILDGSVSALKVASTSAGASHNIFTCTVTVPSRLTTGKGVTINDITFLYSQQGTATGLSQIAPTLQSFTAPVAGTSETASSATLVAAGGSLTITPVIGSANLTAISAGQYYSSKIALGTPLALTTDLQVIILTMEFDQSGSTATLITTPGMIVHYTKVPL